MNFYDDDDDEEDYEAHEAEQRRYGWFRRRAFFNEVESLWQDYLEQIDYPKTDFIDYLSKNCSYANDRLGAKIIMRAWKLVRWSLPKYLN